MKDKVEATLAKIKPSLNADGGDVELIKLTPDGVVKIRLTGACKGCPMSQMTLKMGIEKMLREETRNSKRLLVYRDVNHGAPYTLINEEHSVIGAPLEREFAREILKALGK